VPASGVPGFDGNSEATHLAYADYFINGLGRYPELQTPNLNSHTATNDRYPKMLVIWRALATDRSLGDHLTKQQILSVVDPK